MNIKLIDFNNVFISNTLKILLKDQSTKKNIIWATDNYNVLDEQLENNNQITENLLKNSNIIQPRVLKRIEEQTIRTRKKAEVFTPAWLCNQMNNMCDSEWFGYENVFNKAENNTWITNTEKIQFPSKKKWEKYIDSRRLEITCGEAPYIVSRYDASTGELIDIENRIGMLDRKIRIVSENTDTEEDWLKWTIRAFESVYGYEYQGDSLLVARVNLLMTFIEYLDFYWHRKPTYKELSKIVNIISWNFFQMNGLDGNVPMGKPKDTYMQLTFDDLLGLTEENKTVKAKTYNWQGGNSILFSSISEEIERNMKFDYVIGNPPYQEETIINEKSKTNGQTPKRNIFHYFQMSADAIATEYSILIYPGGRWIQRSGKGLDKFGIKQINDISLKKLYFYPNSSELFDNIGIPDGISIVVKERKKNTSTFEYVYCLNGSQSQVILEYPKKNIIPLNPSDAIIVSKIEKMIKKLNFKYLNDRILPRSLFKIESDFVEKNPDKVKEYYDGYTLKENEIKLFTNDKAGKAGRAKWFISTRDVIVQNQEYINKWQVIVSSANAGGQKRDNQIEIVDSKSAFGRARVALASFDTEKEALNFYKYCKTYVIRFAFLMTNEALTSLAKKVPDLIDYTDNNEIIDFSNNLDEQMYKLLNLTFEEIEYIKEKIDNIRKK